MNIIIHQAVILTDYSVNTKQT